MHVWNVLLAARCKYRTQKYRQKSPSGHHRTTSTGYIFANKAGIDNLKKNLLSSNSSSTCPYNMVNFGPLVFTFLASLFSNWCASRNYLYLSFPLPHSEVRFYDSLWVCLEFSAKHANQWNICLGVQIQEVSRQHLSPRLKRATTSLGGVFSTSKLSQRNCEISQVTLQLWMGVLSPDPRTPLARYLEKSLRRKKREERDYFFAR